MNRMLLIIMVMGFAGALNAQLTRVTDINPNGDADVYNFQEFNNKLYFSASDGVNGAELWEYDGVNTPSMVFDINPNGEAWPFESIVFQGKMLFAANNGSGYELWEYDGVNSPTLVYDFLPTGSGGLYYGFNPVVYNNLLYFRARDSISQSTGAGEALWRYDGVNQPEKVLYQGQPLDKVRALRMYQNQLHFGFESSPMLFCKMDATENISIIPYNNAVDFNSTSIDNAKEFNGNLYFPAQDTSNSNGMELWKFDGTTFSFVEDLDPGTHPNSQDPQNPYQNNSYPTPQVVFQNKLYVAAQVNDSSIFNGNFFGNFEIDASDAASVDDDLCLGVQSGWRIYKSLSIEHDGVLYYNYLSPFGKEVYKYDGVNSPQIVMDIHPTDGSNPNEFFEFDGKVYFTANDGIHGTEIWSIDETNSLEQMSNDKVEIYPNPASDHVTIQSDELIDAITISNVMGETVLESKSQIIDVSNFESGVYFITIFTEKGSSTKRLVKE